MIKKNKNQERQQIGLNEVAQPNGAGLFQPIATKSPRITVKKPKKYYQKVCIEL